jgi:NADPH:quinone reductase-like Zn-dependent oxidoreductase
MKAARIVEFGDPSKLQIVEMDRPRIGEGDVLVAVKAAGVNPSDVSNLAGKFGQTKLPRVPGRDYAGVVVEGPRNLVGKEVWGTGAEIGFTRDGTHAEFVAVAWTSVREKPKNLSFAQSAIALPFVTASLALNALNLQAWDAFIVTGSKGSVGWAAVQLARSRRARTIGIQRGPEKGYLDEVIDSEKEDVTKRISELTAGGGGVACLDTVGNPLFDAALTGLPHGARMVVITAAKDGRVSFNIRDFYHRELTLIGVDSLQDDATVAGEELQKITHGFEEGVLHPPEVHEYPLQRAADAYAMVASGKAKEKLVLVP